MNYLIQWFDFHNRTPLCSTCKSLRMVWSAPSRFKRRQISTGTYGDMYLLKRARWLYMLKEKQSLLWSDPEKFLCWNLFVMLYQKISRDWIYFMKTSILNGLYEIFLCVETLVDERRTSLLLSWNELHIELSLGLLIKDLRTVMKTRRTNSMFQFKYLLIMTSESTCQLRTRGW